MKLGCAEIDVIDVNVTVEGLGVPAENVFAECDGACAAVEIDPFFCQGSKILCSGVIRIANTNSLSTGQCWIKNFG